MKSSTALGSPEGGSAVANTGPALESQPQWARFILQTLRGIGKHILLILFAVLALSAIAALLGLWLVKDLPYSAQALAVLRPRDPTATVGLPPDEAFDSLGVNLNGSTQSVSTIKVLMSSGDTAQQVIQQATASDDPDIRALAEQDAASLAENITIDVRADLLLISARAPTSNAATWLANTWTQVAIDKINEIFSPDTAVTVQALEKAEADLEQAQSDYQNYIAQDPAPQLLQEIGQTQEFLNAAASSNIASQLAIYDNERATKRDKVAEYRRAVYDLEQQIGELQAFRTQIESGGDDQATLNNNQLPLLLLRSKLFDLEIGDLQVDYLSPNAESIVITKQSQLNEVDALIQAANQLREQARNRATELESEISAPLPAVISGTIGIVPDTVQQYIEQYNGLQTQLESVNFQRSKLLKTRDWYQVTYDVLRNRVAEAESQQLLSGVVNVGSPAVVAETERSRKPLNRILSVVAIGSAIALVLGLATAYLLSVILPEFNSNRALLNRLGRRRVKAPGTR